MHGVRPCLERRPCSGGRLPDHAGPLMSRIAHVLRGPLAALAALAAYALLGMAAVIPVTVFLMRDGPARGGVPPFAISVLLFLVLGYSANAIMALAVPQAWLADAFRPIAEVRILPSANVQALLDGDPVALRYFGLELVGACGLAVAAGILARWPGAWRATFADGLKRNTELSGTKPTRIRLFDLTNLTLVFFVGYLVHPHWWQADDFALFLPAAPLLGLLTVSSMITLSTRS